MLLVLWSLAACSAARFSSVTAAICDESHVSRLGSSSCTCPISLRYMRTGSSATPMVSICVSSKLSSSISSSSSSESTINAPSSPPAPTSMPISSSCSYMLCGLSASGSSKSSMTSASSTGVSPRCFLGNGSSDDSSRGFLAARLVMIFLTSAQRATFITGLTSASESIIDVQNCEIVDRHLPIKFPVGGRTSILLEKLDIPVFPRQAQLAQFKDFLLQNGTRALIIDPAHERLVAFSLAPDCLKIGVHGLAQPLFVSCHVFDQQPFNLLMQFIG